MPDQPKLKTDHEPDRSLTPDHPEYSRDIRNGLSAQVAAERLGVSERTIRRAIARGELTATKDGGVFRIAPEALARYRQRHARGATRRRQPETRLLTLPAPRTSFVGRERDVSRVAALLRGEDVQLVTLTGPGGTGKTRLALRVTAMCAAGFADGAAFVPLAPVHEADLVVPTIAQTLGVRETEDQSPQERLHSFLRDHELLLVLDNLEQIIDAGSALAGLLGACSRLTILATSRAPLRLASERVYRVPPLALPPRRAMVGGAGQLPLFDQLARTEAVQLFVERAAAASSDFGLTTENAPAVAAICERVEGLPLAIELAAARTRALTPSDLLDCLSPQLPLLSGGPADQPLRLRSMADAIAWSYDLLSPQEQMLFRRLAVFVGGFSLDAAEWVAGAERREAEVGGRKSEVGSRPVADSQLTIADSHEPSHHLNTPSPASPPVLGLLTMLVDHSLLQSFSGPAEQTRYMMLEPVREYGLEQLAASGEEAAARDAHAAYYVALAERADPKLVGAEQAVWFVHLRVEHANFRAAMSWLIAQGRGREGLRLGGPLWWYWFTQGYLVEAQAWLDTLLAMPDPSTEPVTWAQALTAAGDLAESRGDYERAVQVSEEALVLWRERGDRRGIAASLRILGTVNINLGGLDHAEEVLRESLALSDAMGDTWGSARAKRWLGAAALTRGDFAQADAHYTEGLVLSREVRDPALTTILQGNVGFVALLRGDHDRAREMYEQALASAQDLGIRWWVAWCLKGFAGLAAASGATEQAARLFGAAAALREATKTPLRPSFQAIHDRMVTDVRNVLGETAFAAAWAAGGALSLGSAAAEALEVPDRREGRLAMAQALRAGPVSLTEREREVLRLVVDGLSDKEIAATLGISRATASDHMAAIRAKLGVPSRAAAVAVAMRSGLLSS